MDNTKAGGKPRDVRLARLKALVRSAPESPGVYFMRSVEGEVIYIGKAKVLRNRLLSYFSGRKDVKTRHLMSKIESIEWIIAANEYDALLLENTLIKQHSPKYNINLKDGKTYPSIRITNEDYPRVFRTRRIIKDGSVYFGPFPSAETIDLYLDMIKKIFPLRRCAVMRPREHPCMYYHIGRCSGPCAGRIDKESYAVYIDEIKKLLSGETDALLAELRLRMAEAAETLHYEEAARLRDSIQAVELFIGRSSAVDFDPESRDYISWAADGELVSFVVFQMRDGRLSGRDLLRGKLYGTEEEALQGFLMSYYNGDRKPPPRIFIQRPAELGLISEYFQREMGLTVVFSIPSEKRHETAMALATQNAAEDLAKRRRESGDPAALEELRSCLGLSTLPLAIEGFDIAQLGGKHTVASLVSFKNGVPDKKNYRYFKIKSLDGAIDDFAAIREAVARRYTRLVNEGLELPDLILIDGGPGQVSAAKEILDALGVDSDLAGLAKKNEELYLPGKSEPIVLPLDSPALRILVAVRDETHRFATGLNQRLRSADLRFGVLEGIEGVGSARARRLIREFGSLETMAAASEESIARAGRMDGAVARRVEEELVARYKKTD
jgi:excinuclease ABC subunit C